jgi:hypothetical protein
VRFSCWAVRRRVSPRHGGSDLVLTPALLVYMYSSMESAKQKKLYAGDNKLLFGTLRDKPGTVADELRTTRGQLRNSRRPKSTVRDK